MCLSNLQAGNWLPPGNNVFIWWEIVLAEGKRAHWELEEGIAAISKYFGDRVLMWIFVRKER